MADPPSRSGVRGARDLPGAAAATEAQEHQPSFMEFYQMNVTLQDLLVAGTHFGHLTRRWNPKMRKYIFMERNGIHIIDLKKSLESLQLGMQSLGQIVRGGDKVLFVGTKKQAKDVIKDAAERCNMYYVTERWLGGMLTNFSTIKKSIKRLKNIEKMSTDGTYDKITKKEILSLEREREKLEKVLGGIREMTRLPGALFVVDVRKEAIAVAEANKLGIPVAAIVDTNCDPSPIAYPIPGNDDAFKSISLISRAISDAVLEAQSGLQKEMISAEEESDEETFKKRMDEREFAEEEGVEA